MDMPIVFSFAKSGISEARFEFYTKSLKAYILQLNEVVAHPAYTTDECSIILPSDRTILERVKNVVAETVTKKTKHIFVIGIGGSSLGSKALYDALKRSKGSEASHPELLFIETCDSEAMQAISDMIEADLTSAEECLAVIISKSGTTTETIANAEIIMSRLIRRFGKEAAARMVVISDDGSPLTVAGKKLKAKLLTIPATVQGRFSVFSAAGLFPLAAAGIDCEALLKGACHARTMSLATNIAENPAVHSAAMLAYHYTNGVSINSTFFFHPELGTVGGWYRQLFAESIGKEKNKEGKEVRIGMHPEVLIGSTDLHSIGQQIFGGPNNRITTFVSTSPDKRRRDIVEDRLFPEIVPQIDDKSLADIMSAIYEAVKIDYTEHTMPFIEATLHDIDAYSLGGFMQWKMIEVMYLAALLGIHAFDQPNVESYKKETKRILKG